MSVEYFEHLLAAHGDSPRSLDWSPEGQRERFRVLCEVGIAVTDGVLDVGCGLGHFADYLFQQGLANPYVGVDASEDSLRLARKRWSVDPATNSRRALHVVDVLSGDLSRIQVFGEPADIVVASGVLNILNGRNLDDMAKLLRACYGACKKACAVNMLSVHTRGFRNPERYYYDPEWAIREALAITPRATLRHDYRDNDFTVYMYRKDH